MDEWSGTIKNTRERKNKGKEEGRKRRRRKEKKKTSKVTKPLKHEDRGRKT